MTKDRQILEGDVRGKSVREEGGKRKEERGRRVNQSRQNEGDSGKIRERKRIDRHKLREIGRKKKKKD